jgi:hypothetical protein
MLKLRFVLVLAICSIGGSSAVAQRSDAESDLKAAFIYNFTKYIEWDESEPNEFSIGVIGSSPTYLSLLEIAKKKTANEKKIVVRHFNKPEEIINCDILFISANSTNQLPAILGKINKGTLTISEEDGAAEQGTAFNFVLVNDKLKFEANVKAINAAGLKASSQLLKLAKIVD